jgi:hypothetical protein
MKEKGEEITTGKQPNRSFLSKICLATSIGGSYVINIFATLNVEMVQPFSQKLLNKQQTDDMVFTILKFPEPWIWLTSIK